MVVRTLLMSNVCEDPKGLAMRGIPPRSGRATTMPTDRSRIRARKPISYSNFTTKHLSWIHKLRTTMGRSRTKVHEARKDPET